ncbi:MAG: phosphohistidine phosphatase SixA [bacterium]
MPLYLVQHGRQIPKDQDPEQHLSEDGKRDVEAVGQEARDKGLEVSRILHSSKVRAQETAEALASILNPPEGTAQKEGIQALDDVKAIAPELDPNENLMLVGHLPFMEKLASYLITGDESSLAVKFQNGGIVCLDKQEDADNWHVRWELVPRL